MTKLLSFKYTILLVFAFMNSPYVVASGSNEMRGIILDRTITLSGHAFYKSFSAHWLAANLSQPTNLVIREKPSARWGNLIIISSQGQVLYRTSIRPGKKLKQKMIMEATSTVSQKIFNRLLANNASQDMAPTGY